MTTKTLRVTMERVMTLVAAYQALHASARTVKDNRDGAIVMVPFSLSGNARVILNESIAQLLKVADPHNKAVEELRETIDSELDDQLAALKQDVPDDDERASAERRVRDDADKRFDKETRAMLKREKEIVLELLDRKSLNEAANAFNPVSFALLLNEGLIEGTKTKPEAAG